MASSYLGFCFDSCAICPSETWAAAAKITFEASCPVGNVGPQSRRGHSPRGYAGRAFSFAPLGRKRSLGHGHDSAHPEAEEIWRNVVHEAIDRLVDVTHAR